MELVNLNSVLSQDERQPFRKLFRAEAAYVIPASYHQNKRITGFRQFAVSYIEEFSKCDNFDAYVPYLAMSYFDRFISSHSLPKVLSNDEDNVKLFVLCCLTLASKMRTKAFIVDSFLAQRRLQFDTKQVMKMELHMLNILEWQMRPLTAISFVGYFISLLRLPPRKPLQLVYQIIIRSQADIRFTQFRPSIIAAAAVIISSSNQPAEHFNSMTGILSSCEFVRAHEMVVCFNAIETTKYKPDEALWALIGDNAGSSSKIGTSAAAKSEPREGWSSSPRGPAKPSQPIPIPVPGSPLRAAQPRARPVDASSALLLAAVPPVGKAVEPPEDAVPLAALAPGAVAAEELNLLARGKAPMNEIEVLPPPEMDDPYMNFELRWTDPEEPKVTIASFVQDLMDDGGPDSSVGPEGEGVSLNSCWAIIEWLKGLLLRR